MHVHEKISSHMEVSPAAYEREKPVVMRRKVELYREGSMEKEGSTMHYKYHMGEENTEITDS